jgi:hypothetical protein
MLEFPAWVDEAIQRRYYDLDKSIHKHVRVQNYRAEEKLLFNGLKNVLNENQQILMMQWEEKEAYCTGIEKELIYRQGLMDGAQLIIALLQSGTTFHMEPPPI